MGRNPCESFNNEKKFRKIRISLAKKYAGRTAYAMPGSTPRHGKNGQVIFRNRQHKDVKIGTKKNIYISAHTSHPQVAVQAVKTFRLPSTAKRAGVGGTFRTARK